jgi:type IV secretion system protein VirB5
MTKNNFPITDSGQKYLELYVEPVVTNTYLKLALLVLSVVALCWRSSIARKALLCG